MQKRREKAWWILPRDPFGNRSELFLLAQICFVRLMVLSVSACLVFVASTERKIGLLPSMAIHISVTTCDTCAADHVVRVTRPSPSVFANCKRSRAGAGEGLETRLLSIPWMDFTRCLIVYSFLHDQWCRVPGRSHATNKYCVPNGKVHLISRVYSTLVVIVHILIN